ncbi:hypothetical protein Thein_2152 [Thermodesulfatator indicus DSM 15286]|uniref:Lysylphosphatidylglycerol synthetase/UPF0104 n=1 Tax=Thermodesulfatator indicus (strain DSM 15286 / JCM 11887 / CIR29812) TaxID=667014 RepID=F8ADP2_THEID|nr:lysylphosphatidylglycerol synthase transmembrane domain-containing protein [Thermodesulfatator indicus]AEH46000.1 hypothetical protein Thein_2152 [Thermodesulfatator indicus DSM 15286]
MKKYLSFFLKLAVSATLLFYLFRQTNFDLLFQTFKQVSPEWLTASIMVFFVFQLVSAFRWYEILKVLGFKKNVSFICRVYFIGMFFNAFLPGIFGGDLVRIFYLVKEGSSKTVASFSVVYDRAFGFLGALFLLLIFVPLEGNFIPAHTRHSIFYFSVTVLALTFVIVLFSKFWQERLGNNLAHTLTLVLKIKNFLKLFYLGLAVQVLYNIHVALLGKSLGISIPWLKYFLIIPLMGILASLPISLGGFGVREGTLAYFLNLLGEPKEMGIALGFLTYGVALIGGAVGGYFYLRGDRAKDNN